jgi:hypothetical protein
MTYPDANIHHFPHNPKTGEHYVDSEGDPMCGFYFEILGANGKPLHELTGPYKTADEAERACHNAWRTKSFK